MKLNILLHIALFSSAFFLLYHEALLHTIMSWASDDGAYGWLIAAVTIYLIWLNKNQVRRQPIRPAILPGAVLICVGLVMLYLGEFSGTILIQKVSMIPVLLGSILLFGGFALFLVFLLPIGYLIFLTGFIEAMLSGISTQLQLISAYIAYQILTVIGTPVVLERTYLNFPYITLEVVRACNGINHIVSFLAIAVPLAFFTQDSILKRTALIILAPLIGLFVNGTRIAFIGVNARFLEEGANVHGQYGMLYSSTFLFFGLFILILISFLIRSRRADKGDRLLESQEKSINNFDSRSKYIASVVMIALFSFALFMIHIYKPIPMYLKSDFNSFPEKISGLHVKNTARMNQILVPFAADKELIRSYSDQYGRDFHLYIGYFATQERDKKIIDYRRAWMHDDALRKTIKFEDSVFFINSKKLKSSDSDVYFWYLIDDKVVTNQYAAYFRLLWNVLIKRKSSSSIIIIETQIPDNEINTILEYIFPVIMNHFI
jgi:EpsI family protein